MLHIVEGTDPSGRKFRGLYDTETTVELLKDPTNKYLGTKKTTQLPLKTGESK